MRGSWAASRLDDQFEDFPLILRIHALKFDTAIVSVSRCSNHNSWSLVVAKRAVVDHQSLIPLVAGSVHWIDNSKTLSFQR